MQLTAPLHAVITPWGPQEAAALARWLVEPDADRPGELPGDVRFALTYESGALRWARVDDALVFGHPSSQGSRLLHARVFGPAAEVLLWRTDHAWSARTLQDAAIPADSPIPAVPASRRVLLLGGSVSTRTLAPEGFTDVETRGGRQQRVPITVTDESLPAVMEQRHYFRRRIDTGEVAVAATRWINVRPRASGECEL